MNLKQRFKAPDNKTLSKIANYLLYVLLPFLETSIAAAVAADIINEKQAYWYGFGVSFIIVNIKLITKFSTDETPE